MSLPKYLRKNAKKIPIAPQQYELMVDIFRQIFKYLIIINEKNDSLR